MKSYNGLYDEMMSRPNIFKALKDVEASTGNQKEMAEILSRPDPVEYMREWVKNYRPFKHRGQQINDGISKKIRTIIVPTAHEQVLHHMCINVFKPVVMDGLYELAYGSIPGRGSTGAAGYVEHWVRNQARNTKYCLKMDIKKFFDSIPHDILKMKLEKRIKDKKFLEILCYIIDTTDEGIPLGFYTSQWFANFYLKELDHIIKEVFGAGFYIRYMDDMVIFGKNKRKLHRMRDAIESYLEEELGLRLKENWQVFKMDYIDKHGNRKGRDLDFMGYRFFRDRTILRKTLMMAMSRKALRLSKKERLTIYDCKQMASYKGWLDHTDTYELFHEHIKPYINLKYVNKKISAYDKKYNRRAEVLDDSYFCQYTGEDGYRQYIDPDNVPVSYDLFHDICVNEKIPMNDIGLPFLSIGDSIIDIGNNNNELMKGDACYDNQLVYS